MNGTLFLDKERKNGARFYFEITLQEKKQKSTNSHLNSSLNETIDTPNLLDSKVKIDEVSILVVEDNLTNQMYMKALMDTLSIKFTIANNGLEAVDLYEVNKYDIILMDENMPLMSGSEATVKIRNIEKNTKYHTPIIALTANALKGDKEKFIEIGMDDYLSKPIRKKDLKNIINKFIN